MTTSRTPLHTLRYVPADRVEAPGVEGLTVESDGRLIGQLAGLVVEPSTRRLRYLVVETERWFGKVRRLLPFSVATFGPGQRSLHVDVDDSPVEALPEFDPRALRELSEEDFALSV